MVKYTYTPYYYEAKQEIPSLLKQVWNFIYYNSRYSEIELQCGDIKAGQDWIIEQLRQKWKVNFVNFNEAIEKVKEHDIFFINFFEIDLSEIEDSDFEEIYLVKTKLMLFFFIFFVEKWSVYFAI